MEDIQKYFEYFETNIIVNGFMSGCCLGIQRMIPAKTGKLTGTQFANFIGQSFYHEKMFAIDYYGYIKKSSAIITKIKDEGEISGIMAPIIYFASLKPGNVEAIEKDNIPDFYLLKEHLLNLRGFK